MNNKPASVNVFHVSNEVNNQNTKMVEQKVPMNITAHNQALVNEHTHFCFIRNSAQGLVLNVPYFLPSFYQVIILKVP